MMGGAGLVDVGHPPYDVFLAHNSTDRAFAEQLAGRLQDEAGLWPFFDKWHLVAGEPVQESLEAALENSQTCAVLVGASGAGPWENEEFRIALDIRVRNPKFRVIPVLIPGASASAGRELPPLLRRLGWIDLRGNDPSEEAFGTFVAAIRGRSPGRPSHPWIKPLPLTDVAEPTGLAVEGNTLFVADHAQGTITKVTGDRIEVIFSGLVRPHHLANMSGTLLIADTYNDRVLATTLAGDHLWEQRAFCRVRLRRPHAVISVSPGGFYLLSSDTPALISVKDRRCHKCIRNPRNVPNSAPGRFSTPCGLGASAQFVFVADTFNHRIQVFDHRLEFLGTFGEFGYRAGQFAYPVGIGVWHDWIVIADEHNRRLQLWRVNAVGNGLEAEAITEDMTEGLIRQPFAPVFSLHGDLYVTDRAASRVFMIEFQNLIGRYAG